MGRRVPVAYVQLRESLLVRPSLGTVCYARYFNGVFNHTVNDEEGKRRYRHFPCAFHTSLPAAIGEGTQ
jgi:hypothetical protein